MKRIQEKKIADVSVAPKKKRGRPSKAERAAREQEMADQVLRTVPEEKTADKAQHKWEKTIQNLSARIKEHTPRFVYICSPYAGDVEANVMKAKRYCRLALSRGCVPIAPHLMYPRFLDDENQYEREVGLYCGLSLLDKCAEVWVFGQSPSEGMDREIYRGEMRCKAFRWFTEDMKEVGFHA